MSKKIKHRKSGWTPPENYRSFFYASSDDEFKAKHPIGYETGRIISYFIIAMVIYGVGAYLLVTPHAWLNYIIRTLLIAGYVVIILKRERIAIPGVLRRHA